MLFNSFVFLLAFLPITYGVFWLLRSSASRYVWLTITGYVFYGYWDPSFCVLMAFSTLVSYFGGLGLLKATTSQGRKWCLWLPVAADLSLLAFFKYANFGLDSIRSAAALVGWTPHLPNVDVVLPVGISFYTFHTISYVVDAYRGVIKPTRNIFEYSAYVSLFSQLVAGPIVRFRQVEQDLEALGKADRSRWLVKGLSFFAGGLFTKVVIADSLAVVADSLWSSSAQLGTVSAWTAVSAYSLQLYFDFSGYSTMAIGLGYLFGIRIPDNFNSPYKSVDPADFWRRWHISLSQCLRDYVYIPFGGSRGTQLQTYRNLLLTMLIGGLWHGANWTFVIWGGYHGLALGLHRRMGSLWDGLPVSVRRAGMLVIVMIGWVFFRAPNIAAAGDMLGAMFSMSPSGDEVGVGGYAAILVSGAVALVLPNARQLLERDSMPLLLRLALVLGFGASLGVMSGMQSSPFLYFQF